MIFRDKRAMVAVTLVLYTKVKGINPQTCYGAAYSAEDVN